MSCKFIHVSKIKNTFSGFPCLGVLLQKLENPALRSCLKVESYEVVFHIQLQKSLSAKIFSQVEYCPLISLDGITPSLMNSASTYTFFIRRKYDVVISRECFAYIIQVWHSHNTKYISFECQFSGSSRAASWTHFWCTSCPKRGKLSLFWRRLHSGK